MKNILTTPPVDDIQNDAEAGSGEPAEIEDRLAAQSADQALFLDLSRRLRRYHRSQHRPPWWDRCIFGCETAKTLHRRRRTGAFFLRLG